MSLSDKAKAAREIADLTGDPYDVVKAEALEGAQRAESDAVLLAGLSEPDPGVPFPKWSEVSEPGTAEGPLR
jgi:hypothetical protein